MQCASDAEAQPEPPDAVDVVAHFQELVLQPDCETADENAENTKSTELPDAGAVALPVAGALALPETGAQCVLAVPFVGALALAPLGLALPVAGALVPTVGVHALCDFCGRSTNAETQLKLLAWG